MLVDCFIFNNWILFRTMEINYDFLSHFSLSLFPSLKYLLKLIYRHVIVVWIHHRRHIDHLAIVTFIIWNRALGIPLIRVLVHQEAHLYRLEEAFVLLMEISLGWGMCCLVYHQKIKKNSFVVCVCTVHIS